jgi:hypothetical protein
MHTPFDTLYRPPHSPRPMFCVTLREATMKTSMASLGSVMLTEAVVAKNRKAGLNYCGSTLQTSRNQHDPRTVFCNLDVLTDLI